MTCYGKSLKKWKTNKAHTIEKAILRCKYKIRNLLLKQITDTKLHLPAGSAFVRC